MQYSKRKEHNGAKIRDKTTKIKRQTHSYGTS